MEKDAMSNSKKVRSGFAAADRVVAIAIILLLSYSVLLLAQAYFSDVDITAWIWDRHQNLFSWYSRPLFIIPACYYAYRHKLWYTVGFMVLMFTSLFWFAAPTEVSPYVSDYLAWEKEFFLVSESVAPLVLLVVAVVGFLAGLFYAFYTRSLWYGLLLINAGTLLKVIVSVGFGGESGFSSVVPSLSSLMIIDAGAFLLWYFFYKKRL